jgi:hypothetical protein
MEDAESSRSHWPGRVGLGLLAGAIVAGLASVVAWQQTRDSEGLNWDRKMTQSDIQFLGSEIESYRKEFGTLPRRLEELGHSTNNFSVNLTDLWGRPLNYSVEGTNYLILSFGRDGKPGGRGFDCDISSRDLQPVGSNLTFRQFLFDAPTCLMLITCGISGVLTAFLVAFLVKDRDLNRAAIRRVGFKILATVIGAVIVGAMLAAVHVPVHTH